MKTEMEFDAPCFRETAYGVVEELGMQHQKMTIAKPVKMQFTIEWEVGEDEFVEIGIWVEDNKVVDYDGVFELSEQAIKLLKDNGFVYEEIE